MKKCISVLLATIMMLSSSFVVSANTNGSMENFKTNKTYTAGQFADVSNSDWYAENVKMAYELSLVNGTSDTSFSPNSNLTIAEAITLASRMNNIYYGNTDSFVAGDVWYQTYVDYAIKNGIIKNNEYSNFDAFATRSQFAQIFSSALPDDALQVINQIADDSIPDVPMQSSYSNAVYKLYRAGILTGNDANGTFAPNSYIQRSEVATIVSRMANKELRKKSSLSVSVEKKELSTEEIYQKCSSSVVYIEVFNANNTLISSGSGFFIDNKGTVVTNYHVIERANSVKITLSDTNDSYSAIGVYDYNVDEDWAILKIEVNNQNYLQTGSEETILGGSSVCAIGSPLGLQDTISQGIISNPKRVEDGITYIQTSAAISSGSSGGALINKYGEVIGITSASYVEGQNLNLALPLSYIKNANKSHITSFITIITGHPNSQIKTYAEYIDVPDFGAYNAVPLLGVNKFNNYTTYYYSLQDLKNEGTYTWSTNLYAKLLKEFGFSEGDSEMVGEIIRIPFKNSTTSNYYTIIYTPFNDSYNGIECCSVTISKTKRVEAKGYSSVKDVPDFGAYFGVTPTYFSDELELVVSYVYSLEDLYNKGVYDTFFEDYWDLLLEWGFENTDYEENKYGTVYTFENVQKGLTINYSAYDGDARVHIFKF